MLGTLSKLHRPAGAALNFLFKGQGPGEIAMRVTPDILFGGLEAAMTPGDITDKAIAGLSSATGGVTGGLLLGKLGGKNPMLSTALDMAGSIGGDFAGRAVGDSVMRGKDLVMGGKGQNPYERLSEEQQQLMMQDAKAQVLAELGLLPGGYQTALVDPTLAMNGLGG